MRLPFFRPRSTRIAEIARVALTGSGPHETPPPQPRELIDVLGIGLTETVGSVALTLLSVERYREGQIVLFRLHRARGLTEREFPSPRLDLVVMPEAPIPYRIWMAGGSGGGMRELEYRQRYVIVPAPPSDGSATIIEVRAISWERYGGGAPKVVSVDAGPWRFRIINS